LDRFGAGNKLWGKRNAPDHARQAHGRRETENETKKRQMGEDENRGKKPANRRGFPSKPTVCFISNTPTVRNTSTDSQTQKTSERYQQIILHNWEVTTSPNDKTTPGNIRWRPKCLMSLKRCTKVEGKIVATKGEFQRGNCAFGFCFVLGEKSENQQSQSVRTPPEYSWSKETEKSYARGGDRRYEQNFKLALAKEFAYRT